MAYSPHRCRDAPRYFNGARQNIGIILGPASAGLTDLDLDSQEAILAAPYLLPRTAAFGHASKRASHWIYKTDIAQREDRAALKFMSVDKVGLLEVRMGGGGRGGQTIFPPSTHVSGEPIAWEDRTRYPGDRRRRAAALRLPPRSGGATRARLSQCWRTPRRRLFLGGFLTRCDFTPPEIALFVEAVAAAGGQPGDKRRDMIRTAKDGAAGGKPAGFPLLAETFGKDVAKKCADWLGYRAAAKAAGEASAQAAGDNVINLETERLARLRVVDYERERTGAAKKLGMRASVLDKIVAAARPNDAEHERLKVNRTGVPHSCVTNCLVWLDREKQRLAFNEMGLVPEIYGRPMTDADIIDLTILVENSAGIPIRKEHVRHVAERLCKDRSYHPIRDYLAGLQREAVWDGNPRLDEWMTTYLGVEKHPTRRRSAKCS